MQIKNQQFYEALKAYTLKAIQLIKELRLQDEVQFFPQIKWQKSENNHIKRTTVISPNWNPVYLRHENKFKSLEEYKKCLSFFPDTTVIKSRLDTHNLVSFSGSRMLPEQLINFVLMRMLYSCEKIFFKIRLYKKFFTILENELGKTTSVQKRLTPLAGFTSVRNRITLNKKITIRRLKAEEIINLLEKGFVLGKETFNFLYDYPEFAIVVEYEAPLNPISVKTGKLNAVYDEFYNDISIEYRILNSFRLYKSEPVIPLGILFFEETLFSSPFKIVHLNHPPSFPKPVYVLSGADINRFKRLWSAVDGIVLQQKRKFLEIAISRFGQALDKSNLEDRIIDFSICAEALFLNELGGTQGELTYRLSLRAACFLEREQVKRKAVFKFFKDFYNMRSQIVHGSRIPKKLKDADGKPATLFQVCQVAEGYLREAILKMVELAKKRKGDEKLVDWEGMVL